MLLDFRRRPLDLVMASLFAALLSLLLSAAPALSQQREERTITRIAFASCADQRDPQPIWDAVFAYRPDLFLFIGDNVYGSAPREQLTAELPVLREAYRLASTQPHYHRLRSAANTMVVWDDHDFGLNDGGADHPFKAEAKQLFLDFWHVPADDARRTREGVHHATIMGPPSQRVQVIMLDTRWWRSPLQRANPRGPYGPYEPSSDPKATLLGDAQWAWLAEELRKPADLRLVVSSIQLVADGHGWERWGNFPRERERFFRLITETNARGVIVLSGDRHIGGIYREEVAAPYPIMDVTASPVTRPFPSNREPGPNRVGAIYGMENFGAIDIDWWSRELTLSLRNEVGESVRRVILPFDALGIAASR